MAVPALFTDADRQAIEKTFDVAADVVQAQYPEAEVEGSIPAAGPATLTIRIQPEEV